MKQPIMKLIKCLRVQCLELRGALGFAPCNLSVIVSVTDSGSLTWTDSPGVAVAVVEEEEVVVLVAGWWGAAVAPRGGCRALMEAEAEG